MPDVNPGVNTFPLQLPLNLSRISFFVCKIRWPNVTVKVGQ